MPRATYLLALGSNRRGRHGSPAAEIRAALLAIGDVVAASRTIISDPVGPSIRRYANAAALVASDRDPPAMLRHLKAIERRFGRRRGQRWGARVIDLDIILWSGGVWRTRSLTIPHPVFSQRPFVLQPAASLSPEWRDPVTNRSLRQLAHMVDRRRPAT